MIDGLLATLERDAEGEIARVLAAARARAADATKRSEARCAERRRTALEQREADRRAALERDLAAARHDARALVLTARERLLDRVFAGVRTLLPAVANGAAYRATLATELDRVLTFVGEQGVVAHCATGLAPLLRGLVKTNGRLTIHPDPAISAGFRLVTASGRLEVDATLEGRLTRLRPRLALAVLRRIGASS